MPYIATPVVTKKIWTGPVHLVSRDFARAWDASYYHCRKVERRQNNALVAQIFKRHCQQVAKRSSENKVTSKVSFAAMASRVAVPDKNALSFVPEPREDKMYISRKTSRQMYSIAQTVEREERKTFRALAEAIANRHKRIRWVEQDSYTLNEKRPWVKIPKPKEVTSFPIGCYHVRPTIEDVKIPSISCVTKTRLVTSTSEEVKQKKVLCVSPKQVKVRNVRVDNSAPYEGLRPTPKRKVSKPELQQMLITALSKTALARQLCLVYLVRLCQIRNKMDIVEELQKQFQDIDLPIQAENQMDNEGATQSPNVSVDVGGSFAMATQKMGDVGTPSPSSSGYEKESTSHQIQKFDTLSERWIIFDTFDWGVSDLVNNTNGSALKKYNIPYDILKDNLNSPNAQLFTTHRYFRGDIIIKAVINTNAFQVGQLQLNFLYKSSVDSKMEKYMNIYSASSRNHCLINAGSSNDGQLTIRYNHPHSLLQCLRSGQNLGTLFVNVLNQLSVMSTVATSCSITLSAKFENIQYFCNVARSLVVDNQMFRQISKLAGTTQKVLNTIDEDWNRDNPPLPIVPSVFMPQAMSSFAYTDDAVEPLNILRADPRGQTPCTFSRDEMSLDYAKVFGLFKQIQWAKTHPKDKELIRLDVSPLLPYTNYPVVGSNGPILERAYPPLSVISSLFGFWRGSLKYRFDIVGSKFHTGTLLVTFLPFSNKGDQSISILKYSHSLLIDISSSSSFVFETPWYNVNPCRPVYREGIKDFKIGTLYVKVVNHLIAIDNVSNEIFINMYISAGDSFELMIPRMTILAPSFSQMIIPPPRQYLEYYDKTALWYTTYEKNLVDTDNDYYNTFYIKNVTNAWVGFLGLQKGDYAQLIKKSGNLPFRCRIPTKGKEDVYVSWGVYDPELSTANAHGLILVKSLEKAKIFAQAVVDGVDLMVTRKSCCYIWTEDGPWSEIFENNVWRQATASDTLPRWEHYSIRSLIAENQMDNEPNASLSTLPIIVSDVKPTPSTSGGMTLFGERTPDLKSLCRRWIHYTSIAGTSCASLHPRDCVYSFQMGLIPFRHLNILDHRDYDNRAREGTISTVGSGYYLFKGGLRFRFVVMGNPPEGANLYIQHRFDEHYDDSTPIVKYGVTVNSIYDMLSTQYASFVQNLNVNPTVSLEVPYYKSNEALLAVPHSDPNLYSLGYIYGWMHTPSPHEYKIEVYYSFADDSRFAIRQGFPSMYALDEIRHEVKHKDSIKDFIVVDNQGPSVDSKEQEPIAGTSSADPPIVQDKKDEAKDQKEKSIAKSLWTGIKNAVTPNIVKKADDTVEKIKDTAEKTSEIANEVKKNMSFYERTIKSFKDLVEEMRSGMSECKQKFMEVVDKTKFDIWSVISDKCTKPFLIMTQIIHMVLNPTPIAIAVGLVTIYVVIWGLTFDGPRQLVQAISKAWYSAKAQFSKKQPQKTGKKSEEPIVADNNMEDHDVASLASIIYTGLASFCKLKVDKIKSISDIDYVGRGLSTMANTMKEASFVSAFIRGNIEMVKRGWSRIVSYFKISKKNHDLIKLSQDKNIQEWLIDSSAITNAAVRDDVYTDPQFSNKVFELVLMGRSIYMCLLSGELSGAPALTVSVSKLLTNLIDLESSLISRKCYSGVRYEPFCLWLCGPPGTGKSFLIQKISEDLASSLKSRAVPSYHTMTAGNAYFDNYRNQPTIVIDDFLSTTFQTSSDIYAQFLQMKSKALFNPPYAKVDEKDKLINFHNLIITSNADFVANTAGINYYEAFNRRRDVVLRLEFRENHVNCHNLRDHYTFEQIEKGEHLKAFYYSSPLDPDSSRRLNEVEGQSYMETLLNFIQRSAAEYHHRESLMFQKRSRDVQKRLSELSQESESVAQYIEKVRSATYEMNKAVLDQDEKTILENPKIKIALERSIKSASFNLGESVMKSLKNGKKVLDEMAEKSTPETPNYSVTEQNTVNTVLSSIGKPEKRQEVVYDKTTKTEKIIKRSSKPVTEEDYLQTILTQGLNICNSNLEAQNQGPAVDKIWRDFDTSKSFSEQLDSFNLDIIMRVPLSTAQKDRWPYSPGYYNDITNLPKSEISYLIDPFTDRPLSKNVYCCHKSLAWDTITYDKEADLLYVGSMGNNSSTISLAAPMTACMAYHQNSNTVIYNPFCIMFKPQLKKKFLTTVFSRIMGQVPYLYSVFQEDPRSDEIRETFPEEVIEMYSKKFQEEKLGDMIKQHAKPSIPPRINKEIDYLSGNVERVCGIDIPKNQEKAPSIWWIMFKRFLCAIGTAIELLIIVVIWILGVVGIMYGLTKIFTPGNRCGDDYQSHCEDCADYYEDDCEGQIHASGDYTQVKHVRPSQKALQLVRASHQGELDHVVNYGFDKQQSDLIKKKIINNTCWIIGESYQDDKVQVYSGRSIGLFDRTILTLKHYYDLFVFRKCHKIIIKSIKNKCEIAYKLEDLQFSWNNEGVGICELPSSFPFAFANIVKYMPSDSSRFTAPYDCEFIEPYPDTTVQIKLQIKELSKEVHVRKTESQDSWNITQGYQYDYGGPGKCGSFLFSPDLHTPFIGIHTAGISNSVGFSQKLFRETFKVPELNLEYVQPEMALKPYTYTLNGEYEIVGTLDKDMALYSPTETKCKPSHIHGVFPVSTEPAPLHKEDPRIAPHDPLLLGVSKRCDKVKEFKQDHLKLSVEHLTRKVLDMVQPLRTVSKLSVKEAVEGFDLVGYEKMTLSTSEGYPWVKLRPDGKSDKSWMFTIANYPSGAIKITGIFKELNDTLLYKEEQRRSGLVPASYFAASLKDARILKEKTTVPGKTRVFEISPVDLTIAQRQNFLDFIAAYQTARMKIENTIGINCDGPEWNLLVSKLHDMSPNILTADYSAFGPRLHTGVLKETFNIAIKWYQKHQELSFEDILEKKAIAHEVAHGLHVVKNLVFRPSSGLPSGNAETVEKNSLCNSVYIRLAYLGLSDIYCKKLHSLDYFDMYVVIFHNGDDLIMSVHDDIIDWFNNESLIYFFSLYDIKMTDALKSGKVRKFCTIEEATYLKRGFQKHPYRPECWLAPLEESSILDTANWIWRCPNEIEASLLNSENACRLAYTRGPIFYNMVAKSIKKAWLKAKPSRTFNYPSWSSLDAMVWDGTKSPSFNYF